MAGERGGGEAMQASQAMQLDKEQEDLWNSYTEENREKYFWLFLNHFVDKWEKQVSLLYTSCQPTYSVGYCYDKYSTVQYSTVQ